MYKRHEYDGLFRFAYSDMGGALFYSINGSDGTQTLSGEYTADEDGTVAIYSVSEGDPDVCIYDTDGFPLRNDADSGAEISGNEHDFAVVIDAAAGDTYRIFVSGKFTECRVIRALYTGDGTSLGPDDIEAVADGEGEITGEEK